MNTKYKIEDFTAEDRYGYDVFIGVEPDPHEPRTSSDDVWEPHEQEWVKSCERMFHDGYLYRRPMPLGNAAGQPPEWRLVGWDEPMQVGDQEFHEGTWKDVAAVFFSLRKSSPHIMANISSPECRAVRRRVTAAVSEPSAAPQETVPAAPIEPPEPPSGPTICQECHNPSNLIVHQSGKNVCMPCARILALADAHTKFALCPKCGASRHCRHCEPEPKLCGEWVFVKDETPPDGEDVLCELVDGGLFKSHTLVWKNKPKWTGVLCWLRLFPEPPPPPVPEHPCCEEWAGFEDYYGANATPRADIMRFKLCPFCGTPRPAKTP